MKAEVLYQRGAHLLRGEVQGKTRSGYLIVWSRLRGELVQDYVLPKEVLQVTKGKL